MGRAGRGCRRPRRRHAGCAHHRLLDRHPHARARRCVRGAEGRARRPRFRRRRLQGGRRGRTGLEGLPPRQGRRRTDPRGKTRWPRWKPSAERRAFAATPASSPSPAASARPAPRRCCGCACRMPAPRTPRKSPTTTIGACRSRWRACRKATRVRRIRDRHEPCRRDHARSRTWCGRTWRSSPRWSPCTCSTSRRWRPLPRPRPRSCRGWCPAARRCCRATIRTLRCSRSAPTASAPRSSASATAKHPTFAASRPTSRPGARR